MLKAYCTYTLLSAVKIVETKEIVELMLKSSDHNLNKGDKVAIRNFNKI